MRTWSFRSAGRIVFGVGGARRVGELLRHLRIRRCLLVTDRNLARHASLICDSAAACDVECCVFDGGEPEPTVALVEEVLGVAEGERLEAVIGLGGGSNIDVAKAAAVVLTHGGSIADYAGQCKVPGPTVPIVAVPTTAGSGSEVSGACILRVSDHHSKIALVDDNLRPALAVVDPELHRSCPPSVTRDAGIDAFCHAVEAFTIVDCAQFPREAEETWPLYQGKHPFTDTLAERAIEVIARSLPWAMRAPDDVKARSEMAMGALLAGIAMSNTGLYTVHALSYPVGAFTGASHGACNGVLLPSVLDFVEPTREAEMERIVHLMGSDRPTAGDAVRDLLRTVGAPTTLRQLGLSAEQMEPTAEIAYEIRRLMDGSPRPTSPQDLLEIVRHAYGEIA